MSCSVPDCNNSIGMPFPEDPAVKQKWLRSLRLEVEPAEKSFVCLDHFRPSDIIEQSDVVENDLNPENVRNLVVLRKGAVPFADDDGDDDRPDVAEEDELQSCRVCNGRERLERNVSETLENGTTIMSMIMLCCYPVVITKSDALPKFICTTCLKQLQRCFKFRSRCLKTNKLWNERVKKQSKRKDERQSAVSGVSKKARLETPTGNEELIMKEDDEGLDRDSSTTVKSELESSEAKETPPIPQVNDKEATSQDVPIKSDSNEEVNEEIVPNVNLPKGIRIVNTTKQSFESDVGQFPCVYIKGPQESDFALADEYLFTFGLVKGETRYLKCIVPTCKAKGTQFKEEMLTLDVAHNHERPDDQLRKKHMFFYIMRKRMQLDKSLNIRMIYEEICVQEPEIRKLVPLRNVINEICKHQTLGKIPPINSFIQLYDKIEEDAFERLHFTSDNKQFYQERFRTDDGCYAIIFCNRDNVERISTSNLMYVDASFKITNVDDFQYHLVTALVWTEDSYYPILFGLVNKKSQEIFVKIFKHFHDVLAPNLRPFEIVTDYESSLYYALGETYLESHIGGSMFYYVQNIYKKICSLNLAKELETNSNFRNTYHMLLMLPLLPVNTIEDALNTIKIQAKDLGLSDVTKPIFDHITEEWIKKVTPELFCVHRLENRINENVIAPFKKLRDYLLLFKGKIAQITPLIEKLIELESFLRDVHAKGDKKSFARDLSSFQKRNVVRAWLYIETHPKININYFFQKVLGYVKCMENQLWIWGFYGYAGPADDPLITASNFEGPDECSAGATEETIKHFNGGEDTKTIVMEAVIDNNGGVLIQSEDIAENSKDLASSILTYVHYEV